MLPKLFLEWIKKWLIRKIYFLSCMQNSLIGSIINFTDVGQTFLRGKFGKNLYLKPALLAFFVIYRPEIDQLKKLFFFSMWSSVTLVPSLILSILVQNYFFFIYLFIEKIRKTSYFVIVMSWIDLCEYLYVEFED